MNTYRIEVKYTDTYIELVTVEAKDKTQAHELAENKLLDEEPAIIGCNREIMETRILPKHRSIT